MFGLALVAGSGMAWGQEAVLYRCPGDFHPAKIIAETRENAMAMSFTQRVNPGGTEGMGYFTFLAGYPGPMFKPTFNAKAPESSAYFTFRFRIDGDQTKQSQGSQDIYYQKATWDIYYHPDPADPNSVDKTPPDFADPATFESKTHIGQIHASMVQMIQNSVTYDTSVTSFDDVQTCSEVFRGPDHALYRFGNVGDHTRWDCIVAGDFQYQGLVGVATARVVQVERACH
jgi:hypothetical protein